METHPTDPRRAGELLADLDADRAVLARHAATPTWYVLGVAALTAAFVAGPVLGDGRTRLLGALGIGALALVLVLQQRRLVRPAGPGAAAGGVLAVLGVAVLVLLSVSFGLVAGGLDAWVVVPALVAGALTYVLVRRVDVLARRRAARVR